ncbi:hypothetical protein AVEN_45727-1, partial [Araneus ventricosus]
MQKSAIQKKEIISNASNSKLSLSEDYNPDYYQFINPPITQRNRLTTDQDLGDYDQQQWSSPLIRRYARFRRPPAYLQEYDLPSSNSVPNSYPWNLSSSTPVNQAWRYPQNAYPSPPPPRSTWNRNTDCNVTWPYANAPVLPGNGPPTNNLNICPPPPSAVNLSVPPPTFPNRLAPSGISPGLPYTPPVVPPPRTFSVPPPVLHVPPPSVPPPAILQ